MSEFRHHIVGCIDDQGDTVDADAPQSLGEPRRRFHIWPNAANHAGGKSRARIPGLAARRDDFAAGSTHCLGHVRQIKALRGGGVVARDAEYAHAIAPVGGCFDF